MAQQNRRQECVLTIGLIKTGDLSTHIIVYNNINLPYDDWLKLKRTIPKMPYSIIFELPLQATIGNPYYIAEQQC